ncbi:response regulator transcription factor [Actinomyces respiraculi]|uniref:response regulator transcription factor n=1 Tax=Actinomyces respiraculi TaxID=2744574 RepID=UPI00141EC120|nr:response regulator transcription factor [Actinomyces respiraculi]
MRVLIVDDDVIVSQALTTILTAEGDIDVVATGTSGPEAVALWRRHHPDVLLMDVRMPAGDGLSAAEEVLAEDAQARIVFLTTFADDEYIGRALRMGARGFLIKQDVARIAPALRGVMAGMSVLEGEVVERGVLAGAAAGGAPAGARGVGRAGASTGEERPEALRDLTEREYEVVRAVADGLDNAEIAQRLFMSEGTVRNHVSAALARTGLRNRTQLAVLYLRAVHPQAV